MDIGFVSKTAMVSRSFRTSSELPPARNQEVTSLRLPHGIIASDVRLPQHPI